MFQSYEDYRSAWAKAETHDPAVPLNLDLELAATCNARCPFCLYADDDWRSSMAAKDWDGKPRTRFMTRDMALRLIDEAAELGIPALKLNVRGESTLHGEFSKIVKHARRKQEWRKDRRTAGFHEILVNTNANCPDKSIPGLLATTKLMVSLDSLDPTTYPKIRVGLKLSRALEVVDEVLKQGHKNVWVRRVVCRENKDEDFVGKARQRWGHSVHVSEHHAYDRNKDSTQATHNSDSSTWERRYCGYPSQRVVVEASGRYQPCCISWRSEFDMNKWPILSLKQYWESQKRLTLVNELRQNKFTNPLCKNCTSYMAYRRPERDLVQDVEK